MSLLIRWLINAVALFALPYIMTSVSVDSVGTALIAALVLGLINALIRPILILLTFPVTLVTLGLFIFVINGLMFWLAARWVSGFQVASFSAAILAALVYSLISWLLAALITRK